MKILGAQYVPGHGDLLLNDLVPELLDPPGGREGGLQVGGGGQQPVLWGEGEGVER